MNGTLITVAFVIAVILLLSLLAQKNIKSSWTGCVEKKIRANPLYDEENGTKDTYTLLIRTDAGRRVKVNATKTFYESLNEGDRVEKKPGALFPTKI